MPRKHFTTEQIISKLREAEVLLSQGKTTAEACRALNVSEQTYYGSKSRTTFGGEKNADKPSIIEERKLKEQVSRARRHGYSCSISYYTRYIAIEFRRLSCSQIC